MKFKEIFRLVTYVLASVLIWSAFIGIVVFAVMRIIQGPQY